MIHDEHRARVIQALEAVNAMEVLYELAKTLKAEGMQKPEMIGLFSEFLDKHRDDADETKLNSLLDVLDAVEGFCSPSFRIYES